MTLYLVYEENDDDYGVGWTGNYRYASVGVYGIFDNEETAKQIAEENCAEYKEFELNHTNTDPRCAAERWTDPPPKRCEEFNYDCSVCPNACVVHIPERIASFAMEDTTDDW